MHSLNTSNVSLFLVTDKLLNKNREILFYEAWGNKCGGINE